jgi:hypothetical protein
MRNRSSIILLMLTLLSGPLCALNLGLATEDGGRAGAFLSFGAGARPLGMGKTFVGVADDASAAYWNPAGLVQVKSGEIVALYASLYEQTGYSFAGYAFPAKLGTFGLAAANLNSTGFQLRDELNNDRGVAGLNETAVLVSFARQLRPGANGGLAAGINVKAVNQSINAASDTGFGADLGLFWRPGDSGWEALKPLSAGLSLQNVAAPSLRLERNADTYPFSATLGLGYRFFGERLLVVFDANGTCGRSTKLHFGGEYAVNRMFRIRAGLDETELTSGLGIAWHGYSLDYAFAYHDAWSEYENLGISHRFGLTIRFGD